MRAGWKILPVISLAAFFWLAGRGDAARFGTEFLGPPAVVLHWGGDSGAIGDITLAGARNEHLFVPVIIEGNLLPLKARLEGPTHHLSWIVFRVVAVPPTSNGEFPPDALVPLEEDFPGSLAAPVTIWVSLKIASDCPPGRHSLQLALSDRQKTVRLPVELRVYRFSLPDDLPVTLLASFWHRLGPWNRDVKGLSAAETGIIKEYYQSLREYKFNALGGSYPLPLGRLRPGHRIEDCAPYHELLTYALNELKFKYVQIPRVKGWKSAGTPESAFCRQARIFYPLYGEYLRRHGWEGRALNYLVDEPHPDHRETVVRTFALAKSLAPGIRTLSAGWGEPSRFAGVIDIWAHQAAHYRQDERERAQGRGQEAWLYANRLHTIGCPLAHPRLIGWLLYQYRFSGYLLWGVNYWPHDPWTTPPGAQDFFRRGTFYYPQPRTGRPLASLRLEALRRGFQDYQYLLLLEEAGRRGLIAKEQEADILGKVRRVTENLPKNSFPVSMAELEALRLRMGELLDGASKGEP